MLVKVLAPETDANALPAAFMQRQFKGLALAASRTGAVALQLLVQVAVGWLSGPAALGALQLFTSWTCIGGEVLSRGLPTRTMRVTAVAWERGDTRECVDQLVAAGIAILRFAWLGLPIALLIWFADALGYISPDISELPVVLLAVAVSAPVFALLRLGSEALKAMNSALFAVSVENLSLPLLVLIVSGACWLTLGEMPLKVLLGAGTLGFVCAVVLLWVAMIKRLPDCKTSVGPRSSLAAPTPELRALWANGVLSIVFMHLPFLLLPWFASADEIGVFAVAHKLVNIITTLLILLAAVFGPEFARSAARDDAAMLGALLKKTQWISLAIFTPLIVMLLALGGALSHWFNLPSDSLHPYIVALAFGQLVNAGTGLPGVLLNMAGQAHQELITLLVTVLVTVCLAPTVGGEYGAVGIAWLLSIALACKNIASLILARYHLEQRRTAT
jgi:O-antigen/teichoic acid export membrane protein